MKYLRKTKTALFVVFFFICANIQLPAQKIDSTQNEDSDDQPFEYEKTFRTYMGAGLGLYAILYMFGLGAGAGFNAEVKQDLTRYFSISSYLLFSGMYGGGASIYILNEPFDRLGAEAGVLTAIRDEGPYRTLFTGSLKYDHKIYGRAFGSLELSVYFLEDDFQFPYGLSLGYTIDVLIFDFD